jgi:hypothetical protein
MWGKSLDQYFGNAGWVSALLPALSSKQISDAQAGESLGSDVTQPTICRKGKNLSIASQS